MKALNSLIVVGISFLLGCSGGDSSPADSLGPDSVSPSSSSTTLVRGTPVTIGSGLYETVVVGNQTWLARNLNEYTDAGSVCYGQDDTQCEIFGRLYDYNMALTLCPDGWRLPSKADFDSLYERSRYLSSGSLKANSEQWVVNIGTDAYGFAALPGGYAYHDNVEDQLAFDGKGERALWWTSTESDFLPGKFWTSNLVGEDNSIFGFADEVSSLHSVRCVK